MQSSKRVQFPSENTNHRLERQDAGRLVQQIAAEDLTCRSEERCSSRVREGKGKREARHEGRRRMARQERLRHEFLGENVSSPAIDWRMEWMFDLKWKLIKVQFAWREHAVADALRGM